MVMAAHTQHKKKNGPSLWDTLAHIRDHIQRPKVEKQKRVAHKTVEPLTFPSKLRFLVFRIVDDGQSPESQLF
jgi:hypothetical protein